MQEESQAGKEQPLKFWRRILLLSALMAVVITVCAVFAGLWLANRTLAKRSVRENCHNLGRIMAELHLPPSPNLLQKLRQISESEVVVTGKDNKIIAATLPEPLLHELQQNWSVKNETWQSTQGQFFYVSSRGLPEQEQTLWLFFQEPAFRHVLPETFWWIAGLVLLAALTVTGLGMLTAWSYQGLRHRLEQAQRRLELAERLALAGRLSAAVVHELRNPLSGIKMNAQVLLEEAESSGQKDDSLLFIIREIDRMEAYLRGLTNVSGEKCAVESGETHLGWLLQEIENSQGARFRHAGVQLRLNCPDILAGLRIACSSGALWQVLLNILSNALEVSSPGNTVTVGVEQEGALLSIAVADEGGGVRCQHQEDIFAPFVSGKPHGCGLGLHVCRSILERFEGEISWENKGKGALFRVRLPLLEAKSD